MRDILADREARPDGTRVAMAHRRADVRALNADIRSALQERGALGQGEAAGERTYQTNDGERAFAPGDRIVFLENSRELGVKNGMLGTVERAEEGRLVARLDGAGREGEERRVSVPTESYQAVDHGYATTIHKTQGATVDRSYVLASGTMDRHLTYVAMTRHRDEARLYAAGDEFAGREAGRLVAHGRAPFEHDPAKRPSYFVTLENARGERRTMWGADLERAMGEAKPAIGATIGLKRTGEAPVRLPDGMPAARQGWAVRDGETLAQAGLEARLSRSGAKETVLDYPREAEAAQAFAERRGIAASFGISSEIELPQERANVRQAETAVARGPVVEPSRVDGGPEAAQEQDAPLAAQRPRSMFDGLKLGRSTPAVRPAPERAVPAEADREGPAQKPAGLKRGMFDGLKLNAGRRPVAERGEAAPAPTPERDSLAERLRPLSRFETAIDRYARAFDSAARHQREGLPVLEAQKRELAAAGAAIETARPGSHALLRSALKYDPETARAMTQLAGPARVGRLAAGLERERAALADPAVRTERFVQRWQDLREQREALRGWQHEEARGKVEGQMRAMGQALERDPQVESLLRNRRQELGISQAARQSEGIGHELQQSLVRGRRQSLGL